MPTSSKLAREDWPKICEGLDQGRTQAALAAGYGCSRQAISKLVHTPAFESFRQQTRRQQATQQGRRQRRAVREPVASSGIGAERRGGSAERRPSGRVHPDAIDPKTGQRFPNAREAAGLAPMPDESWADREDAEREARGYRLAEVSLDAPARIRPRAGILSTTEHLRLATLSG